jgi:aryl-alcohol dehydrogenase-like predicted oxidoreductase
MQTRKLGASGPDVSVVGLGTNNFGARVDFETARAVMHKALDLGITLIDTADTYGNRGGSEEALGRILGGRRKGVVWRRNSACRWMRPASSREHRGNTSRTRSRRA